MPIAICLLRGKKKFGALAPCPNCGHQPELLEDKAKHLTLSDHYYSSQDSGAFC
jgi:hypothetical protein